MNQKRNGISKHSWTAPKQPNMGHMKKKQKDGIDMLVRCISGTLTPFSIVQSPQFKEFKNFLDPRFQIPDRHVLSSKHLTIAFLQTENQLKSMLKAADSICVALDIIPGDNWTFCCGLENEKMWWLPVNALKVAVQGKISGKSTKNVVCNTT